jgi:hypothetical protein
MKGGLLERVRRSTLIWCLKRRTSASSATRDRSRSITIPKISLHKSNIGQQHRPILDHPPAGLFATETAIGNNSAVAETATARADRFTPAHAKETGTLPFVGHVPTAIYSAAVNSARPTLRHHICDGAFDEKNDPCSSRDFGTWRSCGNGNRSLCHAAPVGCGATVKQRTGPLRLQ